MTGKLTEPKTPQEIAHILESDPNGLDSVVSAVDIQIDYLVRHLRALTAGAEALAKKWGVNVQ